MNHAKTSKTSKDSKDQRSRDFDMDGFRQFLKYPAVQYCSSQKGGAVAVWCDTRIKVEDVEGAVQWRENIFASLFLF